MTPDEIVKIIQNANYNILWLIIAIAALQFLVTHLFGERIKKSIEHEYKTHLENHKNELLRKKIIYEQQLDAYKAFTAIMYDIYPEYYFPEMEWDDALQMIALGFEGHYKKIKEFQQNQSAILPKHLKEKVAHCSYLCEKGKFEIHDSELSGDGYKMADDLWKNMQEIEDDFRKSLKIEDSI